MKPQYLMSLFAAFLIGGTLFGHYAHAGATTGADRYSGAPTVLQLPGDFPYGTGEVTVLQAILDALRRDPNSIVDVTWTETYHGHKSQYRTEYIPDQKRLACHSGARNDYDYQPVTLAGMRAALGAGSVAPFANASVYSVRRLSEMR